MTQIPIISGIYVDGEGEFRSAYPRNMVPVPKASGISNGYLHIAEGIEPFATTPGHERGGIFWRGSLYRVRGSELVKIAQDGTVTEIGSVAGTEPVRLDYSFDDLAITGGGAFYLYNGSSFRQVTDSDLGAVHSAVWLSGYFVVTDGEYIVVTDIGDPESINPLKYGSSEADPDPIMTLHEWRNELYAVNRHTIEVFRLTGSTGFPFQRIDGATTMRGAVGRMASTIFNDRIAFVGSAQNEAPGVYLAMNGGSEKISTREIDTLLEGYDETALANVWVETRSDRSHKYLYVHLSDRTLVFDAGATEHLQMPIWFTLDGGLGTPEIYPARGFVYAYGAWTSGHPTGPLCGRYTRDVATLYGQDVGWDIYTMALFNDGNAAIVHEIELHCLTGRAPLGENPVITTQFSPDGVNWSQPRTTAAGRQGDRAREIKWLHQGDVRGWRVQRFFGTSKAPVSPIRLEARVEPLAW